MSDPAVDVISIDYHVGHRPPIDDVLALYRATTLGARRPVDDAGRILRMLETANVVVTAWEGTRLVGLSRAMSDFGLVCYLADLLVHEAWQGRGIGKELIRRTNETAGGEDDITLILVSAPQAMTFYEAAGFDKMNDGWRRARRAPGAG